MAKPPRDPLRGYAQFCRGRRQRRSSPIRAPGAPGPRMPLPRTTGVTRASIVTPVFAHGGTERWITDLVRAIPSRLVHWEHVCILDRSTAYGDLRPLRSHGVSVSFGANAAARLAGTQDLLVTWGTNAGAFWDRRARARLVVVAHGDGNSSFTRSVMAANANADAHVCCSPVAASSGFPGRKPVVICNAVDVDRLRPTSAPEVLRSAWRVRPDERLLGFVGRLSWEKNPYAAVATLASLPSRWKLAIVGDGTERQALGGQVARLGLSERVIFAGVRSDMGDVYQALDALIVPSTQEGFGYVIAEAWATRVPVFATPVGAASLWPDAVHTIPNLAPPGIQRDGNVVLRRARGLSGFPDAARVIEERLNSADADRRLNQGEQIVRDELCLAAFGDKWAKLIRDVVAQA